MQGANTVLGAQYNSMKNGAIEQGCLQVRSIGLGSQSPGIEASAGLGPKQHQHYTTSDTRAAGCEHSVRCPMKSNGERQNRERAAGSGQEAGRRKLTAGEVSCDALGRMDTFGPLHQDPGLVGAGVCFDVGNRLPEQVRVEGVSVQRLQVTLRSPGGVNPRCIRALECRGTSLGPVGHLYSGRRCEVQRWNREQGFTVLQVTVFACRWLVLNRSAVLGRS